MELPQRRARVANGQANKTEITETYAYYNGLIDAGIGLFETQSRTLPDAGMIESTLTVIDITKASDRMSRAASLGTTAIKAGGFTPEQHIEFTTMVGTYRTGLSTHAARGVEPLKSIFGRLSGTQPWQKLVADENTLIGAGPRDPSDAGRRGAAVLPVTAQQWTTVTNSGADELIKLANQQVSGAVATVTARADERFRTGLIGSGVALLVVIIAMAIATWIARRLINRALVVRLDGLKNDSLRLAHERLPEIVERLRHGDQVDVAAEVPPLNYGTDEIGQVADAFNAAQYTAIAAAVKESQAREGVNRVFLGIAHRHQGLVHRQLKILDKIEREEENPEHLDALFQLDHLATRARRNAENLIILAGEQPGRQWRKPVRLLDILRAAVAETEQYIRVRVQQVPDVALQGVAVADTIHLVAELVDNAASFSPPRSQVEVYTSLVSGGVVVEIEDHGLGMTAEDREQANKMLAFPPEFDAMALRGESRLGLFVVARLAVRRSIRVELRESPYGGTVALVFLPADIVVEAVEAEPGSPSPRPRQHVDRPRRPQAVDVQAETTISPGIDRIWSDAAQADEEAQWPLTDEEEPDPDPGPRRAFQGRLNGSGFAEGGRPNSEPQAGNSQGGNSQSGNGDHNNGWVDSGRGGTRRSDNGWVDNGWADNATGLTDRANSADRAENTDRANNGVGESPKVNEGHPGAGTALTGPALPRRRRQQHLAPQLREELTHDEELSERENSTPDRVRHTMSAFQRGTQDARRADPPVEL
jgi:signal transduction histidine kinase